MAAHKTGGQSARKKVQVNIPRVARAFHELRIYPPALRFFFLFLSVPRSLSLLLDPTLSRRTPIVCERRRRERVSRGRRSCRDHQRFESLSRYAVVKGVTRQHLAQNTDNRTLLSCEDYASYKLKFVIVFGLFELIEFFGLIFNSIVKI